MIFASLLRSRAVTLLVSKATAAQKLSLPSVNGAVQQYQRNAERAMAGTAQSQTSAVRELLS